MTNAKICGLSTPETLAAAIAGGASHVGFVFFPPSPRNVTPDQAAALAAQVPGHVAKVGVFVDPADALLDAAIAAARLDGRSEGRRVGTEGDSTCRSRWAPFHSKKKHTHH